MVCNRRVSPIAPNPGEGLLTEPPSAVRSWSRERVFMPIPAVRNTRRHQSNWADSGRSGRTSHSATPSGAPEFVEPRLRVFQIGCFETFGELAEHGLRTRL